MHILHVLSLFLHLLKGWLLINMLCLLFIHAVLYWHEDCLFYNIIKTDIMVSLAVVYVN